MHYYWYSIGLGVNVLFAAYLMMLSWKVPGHNIVTSSSYILIQSDTYNSLSLVIISSVDIPLFDDVIICAHVVHTLCISNKLFVFTFRAIKDFKNVGKYKIKAKLMQK